MWPDVRRVLQAFDGREHRDGRRDDAVAIEQRRPDHAEEEDHHRALAAGFAKSLLGQSHQGQGPALALVVGAHEEDDVLDRHEQGHGPEDQRHHAQHRMLGRRRAARMGQSLAQGVERAGADVAEHHADRAKGHGDEAVPLGLMAAAPIAMGRTTVLLRNVG
jgi:hypothetical protein